MAATFSGPVPASTSACLNQECAFEANLLIILIYCALACITDQSGSAQTGLRSSEPKAVMSPRPVHVNSGHHGVCSPRDPVTASLKHPHLTEKPLLWRRGPQHQLNHPRKPLLQGHYCSRRPSTSWFVAQKKLQARRERKRVGAWRGTLPLQEGWT